MKNARCYIITAILSVLWGAIIPRIWPGADSYSHFVSFLIGMPVVILLAFALSRLLPHQAKTKF